MKEEFLGYVRPDGTVGIRNQVLIIPGSFEAQKVCEAVRGTVMLNNADLGIGRTPEDRETIARVRAGLGRNPNIYGAVVLGLGEADQKQLSYTRLADDIEASGKPVIRIGENGAGSGWDGIAAASKAAARLVWQASRERRQPVPLSELSIAVKCGSSDPFSGLAGNPAVGHLFDRVVAAGGIAIFGETTEIIGAEHELAERCVTPAVARKLMDAVERQEQLAHSIGQDIREMNPVPENIKAGISTLEEKSLGAVHKAGTAPIQDVLDYGEAPPGKGLYFMDSYISHTSVFLGFAAAGAPLVLFQLGGGGYDRQTLTGGSAVVAPEMWCTGNPRTAERLADSIDFSAAPVIDAGEPLEQAGERLLAAVLDIASGTMTKSEVIRYIEPLEMYLPGPTF
jgi:altronate dehydratase large subunit